MRVISGRLKGRRFDPPPNLGIRPTTDRAREALFNVLNNYVEWDGLRMLDGFGGSGAIAVEALSRGAAEALVLEKHPKIVAYLKNVGVSLGLPNLQVQRADCVRYLATEPGQFDWIFLDPPYALPDKQGLIANGLNHLLPGGWLTLEHPSHEAFAHEPGFCFTRPYGYSVLSFFQREEKAPATELESIDETN